MVSRRPPSPTCLPAGHLQGSASPPLCFPPLAVECDLTWDLVDEAVGASESLRGRNLARRAHKRPRNSAPTGVQEELCSENEDEEIQDPYDDANVTDCEDDPCDANSSGGDEEPANIIGEFDDGY